MTKNPPHPQLSVVQGLRTANTAEAVQINTQRMHDARTRGYRDGYVEGMARGLRRAMRAWLPAAVVLGFIGGALLRHALGPLA